MRQVSPFGGSTLITSAPKSDRITAAPGPAMKLAKSTTFKPEKMLSVRSVAIVFLTSFACAGVRRSPRLELGLALLQERGRAFLLVVGGGADREQRAFERQPFGLARLQPLAHRLQRELHGERRVGENLLQNEFGAPDEALRGDDLVDRPDAIRILRGDHPARENQLQRAAAPDEPRQALRAAIPGDHSQLHFRLTEE